MAVTTSARPMISLLRPAKRPLPGRSFRSIELAPPSGTKKPTGEMPSSWREAGSPKGRRGPARFSTSSRPSGSRRCAFARPRTGSRRTRRAGPTRTLQSPTSRRPGEAEEGRSRRKPGSDPRLFSFRQKPHRTAGVTQNGRGCRSATAQNGTTARNAHVTLGRRDVAAGLNPFSFLGFRLGLEGAPLWLFFGARGDADRRNR